MADTKGRERRSSERTVVQAQIEFFVNADIVSAQSVDMSETGLRFDTEEPLKIHMRMKIDGEVHDREARFVWAAKNPDGTMTYGLEYIPDPQEYLF